MAADPLLEFHGEHQAIRAKLALLERALDAAMNRGRAEAGEMGTFREVLAFLRTEAERHMAREERSLLPALEAKIGRRGTLVDIIAYDHEEVRRGVAKFAEALAAIEPKVGGPHRPEVHELNRHGVFLVQYLSLHMAKEDSALADLARRTLGEAGLAEVSRRLEGLG